jgi:hypothetical protein
MNIKYLLTLCSFLALGFHSFAQGDLLVTPTRVVFEGNKQKQEINLVNVGQDSAIYSISFIQYKMIEDGSFVRVEKQDSILMFADPFLRIFPRKVSLGPGEAQVIMLQYRRKADMLAGEYRSHLYFRSEKDYKPLGEINQDSTAAISVQLIPVFGMAIPVIIRVGTASVNLAFSDLKLGKKTESGQFLTLTINRSGNISAYGDIIIEFVPSKGKSFQVAKINGIGVYTTISKRHLNIKINNPEGTTITDGLIKVKYVSSGETKELVYAEAELKVESRN